LEREQIMKKDGYRGMKKLTLIFIVLLFAVTSVYYYWSMAHTFVIPSIDGPFYYIQVNSILHTGAIRYDDPPLTFYVFTLFTLAIGNTVTGVMVGSAIFAALTAVSVYFLFKYIFKSEIPAIAASLASAFSAEHIAMASNLMKNAVGIVFIVGVIFFLQRCLDPQKQTRWNVLGAIGFFLLAMFTHVLDEGVAILFIAGYFIFSLFLAGEKKLTITYGSIFLASAVSSVSGFLLLPEFFGTFQKGLDFVSIVSSTSASSQATGGAPPGMSVADPIVYAFLCLGIVLSAYEWLRGDKKKAVPVASATVIGILLILPFIPTDFAWRFQLMEFLPVSIIIGYACARINRNNWPILAAFILVAPVALLGFQTATTLTPMISTQQYADLQHMATLVSTNNPVLVVQGIGMDYWPEFILNLPVVSNSTTWLQNGYNVYLLVATQGQPGAPNNNANSPGGMGTPNNNQTLPGGGAPNQLGPPSMPIGGSFPPQNPGTSGLQTGSVSNATLLYSGATYSLYQL
jgi:4-amino-4-deoxy-L-arabinose transferase-like glycosyltransferase